MDVHFSKSDSSIRMANGWSGSSGGGERRSRRSNKRQPVRNRKGKRGSSNHLIPGRGSGGPEYGLARLFASVQGGGKYPHIAGKSATGATDPYPLFHGFPLQFFTETVFRVATYAVDDHLDALRCRPLLVLSATGAKKLAELSPAAGRMRTGHGGLAPPFHFRRACLRTSKKTERKMSRIPAKAARYAEKNLQRRL